MKIFRAILILCLVAFSASGNAAVGDLVATLSVAGAPGSPNFTITNNPGGYFAIQNGNQIVEAIDTPPGNYSIGIEATIPGTSITQQFTLNYSPVMPALAIMDQNNAIITDQFGSPLTGAVTVSNVIADQNQAPIFDQHGTFITDQTPG